MAKRNKKNKNFLILFVVAVLLAISGICLYLFLDVVQFYIADQAVENSVFNGIDIIFGCKETLTILFVETSITILKFSFLNLLPIILVIIAILFGATKSKLFNLIGALLLIGAAILIMFTGDFVVFSEEGKKAYDALGGFLSLDIKPTTGAYVATGLTGCSGICLLLKAVFN